LKIDIDSQAKNGNLYSSVLIMLSKSGDLAVFFITLDGDYWGYAMAVLTGPPLGAMRNLPISDELKRVLARSSDRVGDYKVVITSGDQLAIGEGTRRTGSTRHDSGHATHLQIVVDGVTKIFGDTSAEPSIVDFVMA
jgi:hypothetical protein